uniref:Uncharacterized protein n=1 Tax=Glossina austeni TaxID=7395 RepID=A0A1A9VR28_GLOAU
MKTGDNNPEPIFSLTKSSTEYKAETAVRKALHEGPVTKRSDEVVQPTAGGSGGGAIKPFVILPPMLLLSLPLPLLLEDILLIFIVADVILAPSQTLLLAGLPLIDGIHDGEDNEQELERMDNGDGDDIEDVDEPALVFIKAVIATFFLSEIFLVLTVKVLDMKGMEI